ncbi:hypothetical protein ABK040_002294 [Willaertia magna]
MVLFIPSLLKPTTYLHTFVKGKDSFITFFKENPILKFLRDNYKTIILGLILFIFLSCFIFSTTILLTIIVINYYQPITTFHDNVHFVKYNDQYLISNNITIYNNYKTVFQSGLEIDTCQLKIALPESPVNYKAGMFAFRIEFFDENYKILFQSTRNAILKYRSKVMWIIETILYLPLYIFGFLEETQYRTIEMLNQTELEVFNKHIPNIRAIRVWVDEPKIQLYSTQLFLHAKIRGLWYYFYYYPIISFFVLFPILYFAQWFVWILLLIYINYYVNAIYRGEKQREREMGYYENGLPSTPLTPSLEVIKPERRERIERGRDAFRNAIFEEIEDIEDEDDEESLPSNNALDNVLIDELALLPTKSESTTEEEISSRDLKKDKSTIRKRKVVKKLE